MRSSRVEPCGHDGSAPTGAYAVTSSRARGPSARVTERGSGRRGAYAGSRSRAPGTPSRLSSPRAASIASSSQSIFAGHGFWG